MRPAIQLRLLLVCALTGVAPAQVNVLTANYGNDRANANLRETQLAVGTVSPDRFGRVATFSVDGQVYAQPLYVNGLAIPGQGSRNVLFVATQHNSVYAFDADAAGSPLPLWRVNLGLSIPSSFLDFDDVDPEVGILSTPVVDPERGVLYVVAETFENNTAVFRIHALDLATGAERLNGPVAINASVPATGDDSHDGVLTFDPVQHLQRPGLLLVNGAVHIAFGSHADSWPYRGWVVSYDAADLRNRLGVFVTSLNVSGSAIWQSGRGLAADVDGHVYCITGNGDNDGLTSFGESFLKLTSSTLKLVDWYTPTDWEMLSSNDYDLSAGAALVPGTHYLVGGNKFGSMYLVDGDHMGHLSSAAQVFKAVEYGGVFTFAMWSRPDATLVYVQEQGSILKAYRIVNGQFETDPFTMSTARGEIPYNGMTISSNGNTDGTGILWTTTGEWNAPDVPGTLHAFDALDLTNEIWNSDMSGGRDQLGRFAKFVSPTVVHGRVYVPTFSGQVVVYGFVASDVPGGGSGPAISAVVNAASYGSQNTVSPGEMITIFGTNLGPAAVQGLQLDEAGLVTSDLGGTRVLFDGVAAPMIAASSTQVSAVVPFGLSGSNSQVQVESDGQASDIFVVSVADATPGVFSVDSSGTGQAIVINAGGTLNSKDNPAAPGSAIVLYVTGGGQTSPAGQDGAVATQALKHTLSEVSAQIGGNDAEVLYAGTAPGIVEGVMQVNLKVPESASFDAATPILIQFGERSTQFGTTLAVGPAKP